MSNVNHGQVFEKGNALTHPAINPNNKNYHRLKTMAERAHEQHPMLHELENPKTGGIEELKKHMERCAEYRTSRGPWGNFTVSQFVVNLLHRSTKSIGENLLLKRIRENDVFMPHPRIASLVDALLKDHVIRPAARTGYVLTDAMKALIEEVKPTE